MVHGFSPNGFDRPVFTAIIGRLRGVVAVFLGLVCRSQSFVDGVMSYFGVSAFGLFGGCISSSLARHSAAFAAYPFPGSAASQVLPRV
jgi:hypothetical protein